MDEEAHRLITGVRLRGVRRVAARRRDSAEAARVDFDAADDAELLGDLRVALQERVGLGRVQELHVELADDDVAIIALVGHALQVGVDNGRRRRSLGQLLAATTTAAGLALGAALLERP